MLRLKISNNDAFIDEWIIIEGDKSFALEDKPFYLDDDIDSIKTRGVIRRLKLHIRSKNKYSWDVQDEMRLADKPLESYFPDVTKDALIVSTDVDEIVKPDILCMLKHYEFSPMPSGVHWVKFFWLL